MLLEDGTLTGESLECRSGDREVASLTSPAWFVLFPCVRAAAAHEIERRVVDELRFGARRARLQSVLRLERPEGERVSGGRPSGESNDSLESPQREPGTHRPGSQTGDLLASMLAADGDEAAALPPAEPPIPTVVWLSVSEGASIPDLLDDRAALYLPEDNLIQANGDFRVYTDMADYWCDEYSMAHGNEIIVAVVREWFQQALVETVLGAQALQGERRWSPKDMETILSPEALTGAVMQRYHVANAVKRTLGAKMGSLRAKVAG